MAKVCPPLKVAFVILLAGRFPFLFSIGKREGLRGSDARLLAEELVRPNPFGSGDLHSPDIVFAYVGQYLGSTALDRSQRLKESASDATDGDLIMGAAHV